MLTISSFWVSRSSSWCHLLALISYAQKQNILLILRYSLSLLARLLYKTAEKEYNARLSTRIIHYAWECKSSQSQSTLIWVSHTKRIITRFLSVFHCRFSFSPFLAFLFLLYTLDSVLIMGPMRKEGETCSLFSVTRKYFVLEIRSETAGWIEHTTHCART